MTPDEEDDPTPAEERTVDAGSEAGVRRQRRRQKDAADEERDFWRAVFATPVGRREIWKILQEDMHAFDTRFGVGPAGTPDSNATWYHRGQQDMGLRFYHRWMAIDPAAVIQMHVENDPRFAQPRRRRATDGEAPP